MADHSLARKALIVFEHFQSMTMLVCQQEVEFCDVSETPRQLLGGERPTDSLTAAFYGCSNCFW